jgi:DnaJ-class molecular chaperone
MTRRMYAPHVCTCSDCRGTGVARGAHARCLADFGDDLARPECRKCAGTGFVLLKADKSKRVAEEDAWFARLRRTNPELVWL